MTRSTADPAKLARALNDTTSQLDRIRDENRALRALLGLTRRDRLPPTAQLLHDLAEALRHAHDLQPAPPSTPTDQDGPRTQPGSRPPTAGNPAHHRATTALEVHTRTGIHRYWATIARTDPDPDAPTRGRPPTDNTTPQPVTQKPTIRCKTRSCPNRDRRIHWLELTTTPDGHPQPRIIWNCPNCGNPFPNHPAHKLTPPQTPTAPTQSHA